MTLKSIEKWIRTRIKNRHNRIYLRNPAGKLRRIWWAPSGLRINFQGRDNRVILGEQCRFRHCRFNVIGQNNLIDIDNSAYNIIGFNVLLANGSDRKIIIGADFSSESCEVILVEDGSSLQIGKDCMFSSQITLRNSDSHNILDAQSGEILNAGPKHICLGDHVWAGYRCTFLKNIAVGNNCIIGANSVVTKQFNQDCVAIAGSPARIVKTGINWNRNLGLPKSKR